MMGVPRMFACKLSKSSAARVTRLKFAAVFLTSVQGLCPLLRRSSVAQLPQERLSRQLSLSRARGCILLAGSAPAAIAIRPSLTMARADTTNDNTTLAKFSSAVIHRTRLQDTETFTVMSSFLYRRRVTRNARRGVAVKVGNLPRRPVGWGRGPRFLRVGSTPGVSPRQRLSRSFTMSPT